MDTQIYLIVAATFVGFVGLAFVLLYPVYRFLRREERVADDWTADAIARRQRGDTSTDGPAGGDGAATPPPRPNDSLMPPTGG